MNKNVAAALNLFDEKSKVSKSLIFIGTERKWRQFVGFAISLSSRPLPFPGLDEPNIISLLSVSWSKISSTLFDEIF